LDELQDLLQLARDTARSACRLLCYSRDKTIRSHAYSSILPREMKAVADRILEEEILGRLTSAGLPILSEERGEVAGNSKAGLKFIVDPLDGTVNFVRGLGPAAVSIAVFRGDVPIFGVLGVYPTGKLAWGGKGLGSFLDGMPIKVSTVSDQRQGVLCTGIPSRFQFKDEDVSSRLFETISRYGKIRMLGAASISLLQVAQGAAELYVEKDIMLWDVAAGLALVEGAGGTVHVGPGQNPKTLNVAASNGVILLS
jgi:myo-inositol-1(or 4)-monophosphatase